MMQMYMQGFRAIAVPNSIRSYNEAEVSSGKIVHSPETVAFNKPLVAAVLVAVVLASLLAYYLLSFLFIA